jgi:expansin (peptidoglycan-binding protein)
MPVNQLHSVENTSDKTAIFSLTQKLKGVQQDRSLTVSKVFPVGAASGARAKSPAALQNAREGKQGSIAKRWSRRTRNPVEGKIEFRGVG